jgi:DNA mismatch endonuclease (patch repair protein)
MADWLSKETRSSIMSSIRSRNTKPELKLKKAIRGLGFSYQPKMVGSPDFANSKKKIAIFVHGCFWHKCPKCFRQPTSRTDYWIPKIERNVQRGKINKKTLQKKGYKVITIWEHDLKNNPLKALNKVLK